MYEGTPTIAVHEMAGKRQTRRRVNQKLRDKQHVRFCSLIVQCFIDIRCLQIAKNGNATMQSDMQTANKECNLSTLTFGSSFP